MRKAFLLVSLCVLSAQAAPVAADGSKLLSQCRAVLNADEREYDKLGTAAFGGAMNCMGRIRGILDFQVIYQMNTREKAFFCLPNGGVGNGQAVRIVHNYLENNPNLLHRNSSLLVVRAFAQAYPCGS